MAVQLVEIRNAQINDNEKKIHLTFTLIFEQL